MTQLADRLYNSFANYARKAKTKTTKKHLRYITKSVRCEEGVTRPAVFITREPGNLIKDPGVARVFLVLLVYDNTKSINYIMSLYFFGQST